MKENETNWNIRRIPRTLAQRVKAEAALRGESIREYVLEAVAERISRSNKVPQHPTTASTASEGGT